MNHLADLVPSQQIVREGEQVTSELGDRTLLQIARFEKDREATLGLSHRRFDEHVSNNPIVLRERARVRSFIESFEQSRDFNPEDYVGGVRSLIGSTLRQVDRKALEVCSVLTKASDRATVLAIWSDFVDVNERDNADQMYISGDRWETCCTVPIVKRLLKESRPLIQLANPYTVDQLARYLCCGASGVERPELADETIGGVVSAIRPVFSLADNVMKALYRAASRCQIPGSLDIESLVSYYHASPSSFQDLANLGAIGVFCLDELRASHSFPMTGGLSHESERAIGALPQALVSAYESLKTLEFQADTYEYRGFGALSMGLLCLRTKDLIDRASGNAGMEFYQFMTSDAFSEAAESVSRYLGE